MKATTTSKQREKAAKDPLIAEYNVMGAKFRNQETTLLEWETFKKDWFSRHKTIMYNAVKQRKYEKDNVGQ